MAQNNYDAIIIGGGVEEEMINRRVAENTEKKN